MTKPPQDRRSMRVSTYLTGAEDAALKSGKPRNIPGLLFVGSSPNIPEPQPSATSETPIIDLVLADLKERSEAGKEKYGTYLQATNGRDALIDAYQEAMDLVMYLRQEIEQRRQRT